MTEKASAPTARPGIAPSLDMKSGTGDSSGMFESSRNATREATRVDGIALTYCIEGGNRLTTETGACLGSSDQSTPANVR